MENMPWVFCGRQEGHPAHGPTCPGTGLCSNTEDHEQHLVLTGSLAPFWCLADYQLRQPFKGEREQKAKAAQQRATVEEPKLDEDWIEVQVWDEPKEGTFTVITEVPLPGDVVIDDLSGFMTRQMRKIAERGQTP